MLYQRLTARTKKNAWTVTRAQSLIDRACMLLAGKGANRVPTPWSQPSSLIQRSLDSLPQVDALLAPLEEVCNLVTVLTVLPLFMVFNVPVVSPTTLQSNLVAFYLKPLQSVLYNYFNIFSYFIGYTSILGQGRGGDWGVAAGARTGGASGQEGQVPSSCQATSWASHCPVLPHGHDTHGCGPPQRYNNHGKYQLAWVAWCGLLYLLDHCFQYTPVLLQSAKEKMDSLWQEWLALNAYRNWFIMRDNEEVCDWMEAQHGLPPWRVGRFSLEFPISILYGQYPPTLYFLFCRSLGLPQSHLLWTSQKIPSQPSAGGQWQQSSPAACRSRGSRL